MVSAQVAATPSTATEKTKDEKLPLQASPPSADGIVDEGQLAPPTANPENSDDLAGIPLILLVFGLCLATFFIALDNTILGLSNNHLPSAHNISVFS